MVMKAVIAAGWETDPNEIHGVNNGFGPLGIECWMSGTQCLFGVCGGPIGMGCPIIEAGAGLDG